MSKVILVTGQSTSHYTYAPDFIYILGVNTAETLAQGMKELEKKQSAYEPSIKIRPMNVDG